MSLRPIRLPQSALRCKAVASDRLQDATPSPTPSTVLIGDPAPPPDPSVHTGDWRNKGIFPDPGFIWQKPAPKASLYKYGMEGTATPLILNLVQLIHWLPYVPAIVLAAHISTHAVQLQANCGVSALQVRSLACLCGNIRRKPLLLCFGKSHVAPMHQELR